MAARLEAPRAGVRPVTVPGGDGQQHRAPPPGPDGGPARDLLVVGDYKNTVRFGNQTLPTDEQGVSDGFVATYKPDGSLRRPVETFVEPNYNSVIDVAIDPSGDMIVLGFYTLVSMTLNAFDVPMPGVEQPFSRRG